MWTTENRPRYNRDKLRYPSDLTDAEWAHIRPLIPPTKRGGGKRRRSKDLTQITQRAANNAKRFCVLGGTDLPDREMPKPCARDAPALLPVQCPSEKARSKFSHSAMMPG
jgi:hypothetical protein